jgi:ribosomal protein S18 acetylase RimI-like enzyme
MNQEIRLVRKNDVDGLKRVLDSSELFPSEFLDEMIDDYFTNPATEAIWFTCVTDGSVSAIGYCAPEQLTDRTYNLYAIAVDKTLQGKGIGKQMMQFIEAHLLSLGKRLLIVETSSDGQYLHTRQFYQKLHYTEAAIIPDFWKDGEHKVVFLKRLS